MTARRACPEPIKSFRIFPEDKSNLYFRVSVFGAIEDLRRWGRREFNSQAGRAIGWCGSYMVLAFPKGGSPYVRPIVGQILLARNRLTTEIISHECTHAAFGYASRRGFDTSIEPIRNRKYTSDPTGTKCHENEERFCRVQGRLVRQLIGKLYEYELLVEGRPGKRR